MPVIQAADNGAPFFTQPAIWPVRSELEMAMSKLERYVGRIVRLSHEVFEQHRGGDARTELENCFLVASVSRELRKLICYGSKGWVAVSMADVVLI